MSDVFDRLMSRPTRTAAVTLTLRPDDAERLAEASDAVDKARNRAQVFTDDPAARQAVDDAESVLERLEGAAVRFTVHLAGIGPSKVRELIAAHPASDKAKRDARKKAGGNPAAEPDYDLDTFAPALLAATVQQISFSDSADTLDGLTVEQAVELWTSTWAEGDKVAIFNRAMLLDSSPSLVEDLGKD